VAGDMEVFTLEALEAQHGDALILHYGKKASPKFIVIDGGPPRTYEQTLRPRLDAIRKKLGEAPLEIRMLMVSHIDDDHITGVLKLTAALREDEVAKRQLPFDILTLWHNSFDDIIAKAGPSAIAEIVKHAAAVAKQGGSGAAIVASVGQGRQLRLDADALAINMNSGFEDLIHFDEKRRPLTISPGLTFTVLGPRQDELDALEKKWAKELPKIIAKEKKKGQPAAIAEFIDKSVHNLSSVIVLAEAGTKRILLTGDARGDFIMDSLRDAKLLKNGRIEVDVLKVPHHGSHHNIAKEFFEMVHARHYVFSANGKYGNPDPPTFDDLFAARPKGPYQIWLTNNVAAAVKRIKAKKPAGVVLHTRSDQPKEASIKIELAGAIKW
jgi:hypothetical protein